DVYKRQDPDLVVRCLEAGASGYLLKDAAGDDIAHYIREVHAGGVPLTPAVARQILRRFRPQPPEAHPEAAPTPAVLTPREQLILTRVTQGFRYAEIAQMEGISIHTVLTHVRNIHAKLGVTSRSEAIFEAMQLGLVDRALPRA
ncbi:MAG: response regulator transcription factor, partial [Anaerolineae bacterium]|nr:response regulator transcription factor [Anaerolineae bacterium]